MRIRIDRAASGGIRLFAALLILCSVPSWAVELPSSWVSAATTRIEEAEYELSLQGSVWQAPNRAHNFRTTFDPDGVRLVPRVEKSSRWEWGLTLKGVSRAGAVAPVGPAVLRIESNRISYDRAGIVEWYINDAKGLEQGFTLLVKPGKGHAAVVVELTLEGTLSAFPSADAQAIDFRTPQGASVVRYAGLRVTDANDRELPARMEAFSKGGRRGIRLLFEDIDAAYPVTIDPLATSPDWTAEGNQSDAHFGYSVATAGDVNRDGYSDVIIGAPLYDNGQSDEGRVYVYHGSANGLPAIATFTLESNWASAYFGASVATAGDVNGDGYSDIIVGAQGYDNGQTDEGLAFVYQGGVNGIGIFPSWQGEGNQAGAQFGFSVATAGDVNGDGYSDVIVGAAAYDNGQTDEGRALVYLGSPSGLASNAAWTAESNQIDAVFGYSVATAGDVNGDGYSDVIVGAYLYDNGQTNEGRTFVYLGSASGLASNAAWTAEGNQANALFGISAGTAGDVNGDGYADVIVGAATFDNVQADEGRVFVFRGSAGGLEAVASWVAQTGQAGAQIGYSVATAGDVNGDGYADVVVGAPYFDGGQNDEGRAFVYFGSSFGLAASAAWTAEGNQVSAVFGLSVATAGDVNGDGYSDLIVAAPYYDNGQSDEGRANLYLGAASQLAENGPSIVYPPGSRFGAAVSTAGDINGDGYSDYIIGAPDFDGGQTDEGRVIVRYGAPFGSGSSVTLEGIQAGCHFGAAVATAGDINGDGYSDIIIGAPGYDNGQTDEGRVFVYLGSASGLVTSTPWTAESDQAGAQMGASVSTSGDLNGDGYSEIVVGAPLYDQPGRTDAGQAFYYSGSASGLVSYFVNSVSPYEHYGRSVASAGDLNRDGYSDPVAGMTNGVGLLHYIFHDNDQMDAGFGTSVASAGDVNGDGYSDFIVGSPSHEDSGTVVGVAWLFRGSTSGLISDWTALGEGFDSHFGASVASAGDFNGDGYSDVIVGAPLYDGSQTDQGRVDLFLGSASGLADFPAWTLTGDQASAEFGYSVAPAGDVNGDGFSDVIVGAPGKAVAYVYFGGGANGLDRIPYQARTNGTTPIALLGKSDSESEFRLRARGRTPAGRGSVRLEWEVKPLGVAFDGTGTGVSPWFVTGLPGATGSVTAFNQPVGGLSHGTFYHWRSRMVSTNPFFPRSPWMSTGGNNVTETKLRTAGCIDFDGDGYGHDGNDPSCLSLNADCNDYDETAWDTPGETVNLRFLSKTILTWNVPTSPGSPASGLRYDTLRSGVAGNFQLADCVETNDLDTAVSDASLPSTGQTFYYLTRAENSCDVGSLGLRSSGVTRVGRNCP